MTLWSRCCGDICICGQTERLDFCKTYDIGHTWSWRSHARTQCACKEHWQRRKSCSPCTATLPPSSPSATWPCYQMPRWPHPRKSLFKKPFQKWKLAKAKLLPWEPFSSVNGKTVDLKNAKFIYRCWYFDLWTDKAFRVLQNFPHCWHSWPEELMCFASMWK